MGAIINKTRKTTLADDSVVCRSHWSKARGLMFTSRKFVQKNALIFDFDKEDKRSIHMMFVFYPIDILFLGRAGEVVEMREGLKPFGMCFPRRNAKYIIELPSGTINRSKTAEGDMIKWR